MKQLTQKLKNGQMSIQEFPYPVIDDGMILVKNHYSVISSGTEGSTVKTARKSFIGKAKERPEQVKKVVQTLRSQGVISTYRAVMKKIDVYSPLGYSCSGEVIDIGRDVTGFKVGDKVACAGVGYANHSEIVTIPENLCVKLHRNADLKSASYNTLGAIAMNSIRKANLKIGENCAVIGLGLLGQLVCQILRASGVRVIGIDISKDKVNQVLNNGIVDYSYERNHPEIITNIFKNTDNIGCDAVIISASSSSLDPINFSGKISRKKGKVVVLGDVPTGFNRNPDWYKKELELKMSTSYGPGRYDRKYEEKGIDYPIAYVRWTQKRNMEAFQRLLLEKKIDVNILTSHEFDFDNALEAFDLLVNNKENFLGLVLKYDFLKNNKETKIFINENRTKSDNINISFLGAGSYAQSSLLPFLKKLDVNFIGIMNRTGISSKRIAEKYNFKFCTSKMTDIFSEESNTIFISTRHDSHAKLAIEAMQKNKNIFIDKPLCIKESELEKIKLANKDFKKKIMVGFNRRFSPLSRTLKNHIDSQPISVIYRINAGFLDKNSWINDKDIGGGRIIGEICHFVDYLIFLTGSLPVSVSANEVENENKNDIVSILLKFENGSTGIIAYFSNGSNKLKKEYVEVYSNQKTIILNDFKNLKIYLSNKVIQKRLFNQDKGQANMVKEYISNIKNNEKPLIPFSEIVNVSKITFQIIDSIKNSGRKLSIDS